MFTNNKSVLHFVRDESEFVNDQIVIEKHEVNKDNALDVKQN